MFRFSKIYIISVIEGVSYIRQNFFIHVVQIVPPDIGELLELRPLHNAIIDNAHFEVV